MQSTGASARCQQRRGAAPVALLAVALAGCAGGAEPAGEAEPLTVYAAASLSEVLPAVEPRARYSFAGSDELAGQIREGAPADVYAAASARHPQELYRQGLVERPVTFAANRLVLVVPADNPAGIEAVTDLARPGTRLVLAAPGVPAGDYARETLAALGLRGALANVVSNEEDVKGVLAKVALGEADAGLVYATDAAAAAESVRAIELPPGAQPPIEYQLAVVTGSDQRQAAQAFVRRVLGPAGRRALRAAGFALP